MPTDPDKLDSKAEPPVWGVPPIAAIINRTDRQTYHLLATGQLPAKKIGGRWCAYPSALRAALRADGGAPA